MPYPHLPQDESYWQALFAEEEKIAAIALQQEAEQHLKSPNPPQTAPPTPANSTKPNVWQMAQQLLTADQPIQLPVIGYNKGGLLVDWHGLQGFVPASQLLNCPQCHQTDGRLDALQNWLNQTITLKIIEINPEQNRLIFSERAAQTPAHRKAELLTQLRPGDQISGTVTNLTHFGAFVDLGGFEGLIHLSELSWSRVNHPADVVAPGQPLTVKVLHVDRTADRIALSLKQLKPDPWAQVEDRYQPGQLVEGVISNIVNYGAFVQIEDELEGLIHLSELAEGSFLHPRNVVEQGESVLAQVLEVDGANKRLALTLRHASASAVA